MKKKHLYFQHIQQRRALRNIHPCSVITSSGCFIIIIYIHSVVWLLQLFLVVCLSIHVVVVVVVFKMLSQNRTAVYSFLLVSLGIRRLKMIKDSNNFLKKKGNNGGNRFGNIARNLLPSSSSFEVPIVEHLWSLSKENKT